MSTFLTAQSLTLAHSTKPLFTALNFTIQSGDKIGLIGHNGCGKSSLLKLLNGEYDASEGNIAKANYCLMSYVEQHIPPTLESSSLINALAETLDETEHWRAELMLSELGFAEHEYQMQVSHASGGQQMRLLLARAIINEPDLLLLDEPSNHLDLTSLMWLESFLSRWKGSFILVSHDQVLLDAITNTTWIMRDKSLHHFTLSCTQARAALDEKDEQDRQRYQGEQKEIDRIEKSAKRLATWGKVYDNEDLARKAKTMYARKERLEEEQTELSEGTPWRLQLEGEALPANRLLETSPFMLTPPQSERQLFHMPEMRIKSGDRIAVLGNNACGKSTLLNLLHAFYLEQTQKQQDILKPDVNFHPSCRLGYYDQSQNQLNDEDSLVEALGHFGTLTNEEAKRALINAGFEYARHIQKVSSLSGGERARLLFIGLSLANFHLVFLDEPTNHLDMEGKEELIDTLHTFQGASLIVSHDRSLIEQACNRFWFIQKGELTEYFNVEEVYQKISEKSEHKVLVKGNYSSKERISQDGTNSTQLQNLDEEAMLERLIELETLLEDDLKRKAKRQKPKLQAQWRNEIEKLQAKL